MICNRHCLPKCLSGSSSLPRDNISGKFMHDHATSWPKYSIICHDTIKKYTISYNSNYCNLSFADEKQSAMENRDYSFIQITRDDKLIDFNYIYGLLLKNIENDTRWWYNLRFWYFLINKTLALSLASLFFITIYSQHLYFFSISGEFERLNVSDSNHCGNW